MVEKAYLKCNYFEGMFSNEYFINFKGSLERGTGIGGDYIVMKDKVIIRDNSSGLIRITIAKKGEKNSSVLIKGAIDVGVGVYFIVPNEELVFL